MNCSEIHGRLNIIECERRNQTDRDQYIYSYIVHRPVNIFTPVWYISVKCHESSMLHVQKTSFIICYHSSEECPPANVRFSHYHLLSLKLQRIYSTNETSILKNNPAILPKIRKCTGLIHSYQCWIFFSHYIYGLRTEMRSKAYLDPVITNGDVN